MAHSMQELKHCMLCHSNEGTLCSLFSWTEFGWVHMGELFLPQILFPSLRQKSIAGFKCLKPIHAIAQATG